MGSDALQLISSRGTTLNVEPGTASTPNPSIVGGPAEHFDHQSRRPRLRSSGDRASVS